MGRVQRQRGVQWVEWPSRRVPREHGVANQGGTVNPDDDLWRVFQFDLDMAGDISNLVVFQDFVSGDFSTPDV